IKRTQTAADLDGEILPGNQAKVKYVIVTHSLTFNEPLGVVNGDLFRPEEEHQQDRNDLGETWGLEEEEQQSDCLPSGDEILIPNRNRCPRIMLTPAELAMDNPTEEEESDEIYSPSKKKATQKKKKHQTPLTPAERAMDEDSNEDDDNMIQKARFNSLEIVSSHGGTTAGIKFHPFATMDPNLKARFQHVAHHLVAQSSFQNPNKSNGPAHSGEMFSLGWRKGYEEDTTLATTGIAEKVSQDRLGYEYKEKRWREGLDDDKSGFPCTLHNPTEPSEINTIPIPRKYKLTPSNFQFIFNQVASFLIDG
ncbi:hypothetical protein PSTT_08041, partial [Puccinia striiformis]